MAKKKPTEEAVNMTEPVEPFPLPVEPVEPEPEFTTGDDPGDAVDVPAPAPITPAVPHDSILVEDGHGGTMEVETPTGQFRAWRVRDFDGARYEHVSDDPVTGEWVYRRS